MIITPIEDKILVVPDERAETTEAGLVIPGTAQQIIVSGTVLSVGPGRAWKEGGPLLPIAVTPGERVLFERHMGTELRSAGKRVLLLSEKHVQGVLGPTVHVELPPPPRPPQDSSMGSTGPTDYDL